MDGWMELVQTCAHYPWGWAKCLSKTADALPISCIFTKYGCLDLSWKENIQSFFETCEYDNWPRVLFSMQSSFEMPSCKTCCGWPWHSTRVVLSYSKSTFFKTQTFYFLNGNDVHCSCFRKDPLQFRGGGSHFRFPTRSDLSHVISVGSVEAMRFERIWNRNPRSKASAI